VIKKLALVSKRKSLFCPSHKAFAHSIVGRFCQLFCGGKCENVIVIMLRQCSKLDILHGIIIMQPCS
jgi:hypothetical protein